MPQSSLLFCPNPALAPMGLVTLPSARESQNVPRRCIVSQRASPGPQKRPQAPISTTPLPTKKLATRSCCTPGHSIGNLHRGRTNAKKKGRCLAPTTNFSAARRRARGKGCLPASSPPEGKKCARRRRTAGRPLRRPSPHQRRSSSRELIRRRCAARRPFH